MSCHFFILICFSKMCIRDRYAGAYRRGPDSRDGRFHNGTSLRYGIIALGAAGSRIAHVVWFVRFPAKGLLCPFVGIFM